VQPRPHPGPVERGHPGEDRHPRHPLAETAGGQGVLAPEGPAHRPGQDLDPEGVEDAGDHRGEGGGVAPGLGGGRAQARAVDRKQAHAPLDGGGVHQRAVPCVG